MSRSRGAGRRAAARAVRCTSPRWRPIRTSLLLRWYERERRDLPWRRTRDPYAILVSEVMLQQTQVARVVPRYEAWLARWPTADALAAATLEEVLREWVGLGYNRRAARLWEAARVVARDGWPERLQDLPGVGPYTAAAVGSFAFGRQEVALDTNARRLFARLGRGAGRRRRGGPPTSTRRRWSSARRCARRGRRVAARARCARAATAPAPPAGARARARERFEDSNRWVRGRVVAALAAGEGVPRDLAADRLQPALQGLLRDGLIRRVAGGYALG